MSQLPDFDAHGGVDKPKLLYDSMVHLVVDVKFTLVSTHRSQETIKREKYKTQVDILYFCSLMMYNTLNWNNGKIFWQKWVSYLKFAFYN